ncbi:hypothetical protein [Streptomyces sp. WMMC897]|uniref:hypothetical protein n=1 Tax=Streptomyces sp. WMMC897 TaxID=3014782 RepID=UPI0022B6F15B|nr:hypothetical protein [Streptomyces sp. WMMC897]MCZ7413107.1 hypothetical protein [Streptomyces sp. WMMC897]MCZ7413151.1 hypothetical protein [Streptomyces sp. WMMC897]MCZ7415509.1 hypothetical protein [Streptomyces sp. WMMC897]
MTKRALRAELEATEARLAAAQQATREAEARADTERGAKLTAARSVAELEAGGRRADARNRRLTELLEQARAAQPDDGALDAVGERLDRALRACARYRAALARAERPRAGEAEAVAELRRTRRALDLAERARRSLDEQLRQVQACNEEQARELRARAEAGLPPVAAVPTPGESGSPSGRLPRREPGQVA